jgi:hypothetical protein
VRRPCCSRLAFHIWPHAVQRQYVDTFTSLLVVFTSRDLQNGQATGSGLVEVDRGGVYTLAPFFFSTLRIAVLAGSLFCRPLMTDTPEVHNLLAAPP